jgi:hypothetical protein
MARLCDLVFNVRTYGDTGPLYGPDQCADPLTATANLQVSGWRVRERQLPRAVRRLRLRP